MKKDIILAGVGGQGILSIATIIGWAAIDQNLHLKQAETHGMSQRGGDVQSHLRLSTEPIYSDLIAHGECDLIVSLEPMEALRYLPWLSKRGYIITNTTPFLNIPNYPDISKVMAELKSVERVIMIDADGMAKQVKSPRSANMALLGAAAPLLEILQPQSLTEGIKSVFGRKGEKIVQSNVEAFNAGYKFAQELLRQ